MRQESASKMMMQLGNEVVGSMMQNALKAIIATEMSKESDAAKAARDAYKSGVSIGSPIRATRWGGLCRGGPRNRYRL